MRRCGLCMRRSESSVSRSCFGGLSCGRANGCGVSGGSLSRLCLHVGVFGMNCRSRYGMTIGDSRANPLTTREVLVLVLVMLVLVLVILMHHVLVVFTHFAFMIVMLRCLCRCNRRSGAWNKNRC